MFTTFCYNVDCTPLPELAHLYDQEQAKSYGSMTAYEILMTELSAINLAHNSSTDDDSNSPKNNEDSNSPKIDNIQIGQKWTQSLEVQKNGTL